MKHLFAIVVLLLGGMTTIARAANDNPAPPDDAMWTICCKTYTGDGRIQMASKALDAARKHTGWKEWFVINQEEGESTLFYGFYKAPPYRDLVGGDPKEVERARKDREKIRALRDDQGNPVFALSYFCEIPRPGSEGPREWDIRNTPADRYWSLIIGEYRDNPDRKKVAVQAVRDLRNEKVEAYYLHGPVSSLVCVGAWPRKALKEQETDAAAAEPDDPNTIVKVYNIPLPKNAVTDYYDKEGKHYKIFAPKVEIMDPGMRAAVDANPYFATNGEIMGKRAKDRNGKERLVPNPSQLLIIPHKGEAFDNGPGGDDKPADQPPPQVLHQLAPKPKAEPGGKLKSLD